MKNPDFWDYVAEIFVTGVMVVVVTIWGYYIIKGEHEKFLVQDTPKITKTNE